MDFKRLFQFSSHIWKLKIKQESKNCVIENLKCDSFPWSAWHFNKYGNFALKPFHSHMSFVWPTMLHIKKLMGMHNKGTYTRVLTYAYTRIRKIRVYNTRMRSLDTSELHCMISIIICNFSCLWFYNFINIILSLYYLDK